MSCTQTINNHCITEWSAYLHTLITNTEVGGVVGEVVGSVVVGLPVGGYDDSSNLVDETMLQQYT